MKFFFNRTQIASINDALPLYERNEFASVTRSTIPLLSLLKHGGKVWRSIAEQMNVLAHCSAEVRLEFTVKCPQGRGKASHTDAMLIKCDRAIAIEAKWTEPPYPRVSEWLGRGRNPENRRLVMSGWLSLLQPHATRTLDLRDFEAANYQTVHRAASACCAGRISTLVYIQFCPLPTGCHPDSVLMNDVMYLHSLLGAPDGFPFWLVEVLLRPTEVFEQIKPLTTGSPAMAEAVLAALYSDRPLFQFRNLHLHRIQGLHTTC